MKMIIRHRGHDYIGTKEIVSGEEERTINGIYEYLDQLKKLRFPTEEGVVLLGEQAVKEVVIIFK